MAVLPIKIAGAGIAGLTAAITHAKRGISVEIHEKRAEIADEGFGIQLSPNALRALSKIGVTIKGVTPLSLKVYAPNLVSEMRMGEGFLCLSRASLVSQLLAYLQKEPLIKIHLNSSLDHCDIDASGIFSKFRRVEVVDSGLMAHRVIEQGDLDHVDMRLMSGMHQVRYPIGDGLINCVTSGKNIAGGYKLYTRVLNYKTGDVAHIGDAAHGMLPMLAQGAAMAIEDAVYGENATRVLKVMKAAQFNAFAYHLPFPMSLARNIVMKTTNLEKRFDWLYG